MPWVGSLLAAHMSLSHLGVWYLQVKLIGVSSTTSSGAWGPPSLLGMHG